jgi:chromosome segregation ATPase
MLNPRPQHIDNLKKENFNIKLKVHFLEERLAALAPDQIEAALKQNIHLKVEVQQRGMELKKLRKLVLELERELEAGARRGRERELEALLAEREREIRELRRRSGGPSARAEAGEAQAETEAALQDAEERNAELEGELESVRRLLEENMDELERLRDIVERRGDESTASTASDAGRIRARRRMEELEIECEELRGALDEHAAGATRAEDEREELLDRIEGLQLALEDVERRRAAEGMERSASRAMVLEEREEREGVEAEMNGMRDKLIAASIEIQQKEDELEIKDRELTELYEEHQTILDDVEGEWKTELDETKAQLEELRDVRYILSSWLYFLTRGRSSPNATRKARSFECR